MKEIKIIDDNKRLIININNYYSQIHDFNIKKNIRNINSGHETHRTIDGTILSRQTLSDGIRRNNNLNLLNNRKPLFKKGLKVTKEIKRKIEYLLNPQNIKILW